MSEGAELRCPRCGAGVQAGQEYCLECGGRLGPVERGATARATASASSRYGSAAAWVVPALLALVVAAIGTGAAIAISNDGDAPRAISVATGGTRTVTEQTPTVTAPEPTTTAPATGPPVTTAAPPAATPSQPPAVPAAIAWPRDRRGWTIVLLSVPTQNGRAAAADQADRARQRGLRRIGILDSSRYASLHPGYYVVFHGVFASEAEAASALQRARAVFPNAYQREIVP